MRRYPDHLVRQARRLVAVEKLDFAQVAKRLRVNNSLISLWCRDLVTNKRQKRIIESNHVKRNLIKNSEKQIVHKLKVNKLSSKLLCAILYGCEGSKYPAHTGVAFVNSDPNLVATFINLARLAFNLNEEKWRIHLQIHDDQNFPKLVGYWSKLLKVPQNKFQKPTITSPKGGKHRNQYYGTCSAKYHDYEIQLKLIGIFEEFMREFALRGEVA